MILKTVSRLSACLALWAGLVLDAGALTPPVVRSTVYTGVHSNTVYYPVQPWMNSSTVSLTVEAWIYCVDLDGSQALVARHYTTNLFFGLSANRLRFYRSGGTFAESDGTLAVRRWTHVAATYDGSFVRFYINGANAGTKSLTSDGNNCPLGLSLGGQRDVLNIVDALAGGHAFNGYLDEVRLWSVARSASAIAANMNSEVRSGSGLLATFGSGGDLNDVRNETGETAGVRVADRVSGFGILPSTWLIPWTRNGLKADGNIDLFNEYRGAETIVLRSRISPTRPDREAYLMVSTNATNYHLFVGVPDMEQVSTPIPVTQVMCDVNPFNGTGLALGDWECRMAQDSFSGGRYFNTNPPLFTIPQWLPWGQNSLNWQAVAAESFEFHQSYEFRIHARNLNYFTNSVGLLVRHYDFDTDGDQFIAPRSGVTNVPSTYARANWGPQADTALRFVSIAGSVYNLTLGINEAGWTVTLTSGPNETSAQFIRSVEVSPNGTFNISGNLAREHPFYLRLEDRTDYTYLPPDFVGPGLRPSSIVGNRTLTYVCPGGSCEPAPVSFHVQSPPGRVGLTGSVPASGVPGIVLRESPRKSLPATTVRLQGSNLHTGLRVFLSKCPDIPPVTCATNVEWFPVAVTGVDLNRRYLDVQLPENDSSHLRGVFRWTLKDEWIGHPNWQPWIYGGNFTVDQAAVYPQLHGFEFRNYDDGPSLEEFEACFGRNISPHAAIWFIVYMIWMDNTRGSCFGMAGTSRLFAEGTLPIGTFDTAGADGVHGVHYANGYLSQPVCQVTNSLCPFKPARWSGFDLFQPFRPINLWARITSLAGAQTCGENLANSLSQMRRPVDSGPRRGFAAGDPVDVLGRIRANPGGYTLCVQKRDFGGGHCVTPYSVVDGMGLDTNGLAPVVASNFSLIKIYDNNWPGEERFIEVNHLQNTFRYNSQTKAKVYDGPGLFYVPMSIYRGPRHIPDAIFLGRYGIEFLRILSVGASASSMTDSTGGRVGWDRDGFTNGYEGALPFVPTGFLLDDTNKIDVPMLFLPGSNAPVAGGFFSGGSNVVVYGGMGRGDIAFGFNAPNNSASNVVDGILLDPGDGLKAMGLRAGAPVLSFGAMVSSRDETGLSRGYVIDAGTQPMVPDLVLERDGPHALKIRNRSAAPFRFRLNVAGENPNSGPFEHAYDYYTQPANSTLTVKLPASGSSVLTRELDTNNDGLTDVSTETPAIGRLRIDREAGLIALRWRQASRSETLEQTGKLADPWTPSTLQTSIEGADRVARVTASSLAQFYRIQPMATNCLGFAAFPPGARPNPWETNGFKFEAFSAGGALSSQNAITSRGGFTGLDVVNAVGVSPLDDCVVVHLEVHQTAGLVSFEAIGPLGAVVARQTLTDPGTGPERVTLRSLHSRIQSVRVISSNSPCLILNVCSERDNHVSTKSP